VPRSAIRCLCWKGNSAGACPGGNVGRLHLDKADTIPNPLKLAISLAVVVRNQLPDDCVGYRPGYPFAQTLCDVAAP
jgi:hypothetical protein